MNAIRFQFWRLHLVAYVWRWRLRAFASLVREAAALHFLPWRGYYAADIWRDAFDDGIGPREAFETDRSYWSE